MADTFKKRDEHRGLRATHLGQDHYEKSRIQAAVRSDSGPTFAPAKPTADYFEQPQQPADVTYQFRRQ